jgi:hypothetical protein
VLAIANRLSGYIFTSLFNKVLLAAISITLASIPFSVIFLFMLTLSVPQLYKMKSFFLAVLVTVFASATQQLACYRISNYDTVMFDCEQCLPAKRENVGTFSMLGLPFQSSWSICCINFQLYCHCVKAPQLDRDLVCSNERLTCENYNARV